MGCRNRGEKEVKWDANETQAFITYRHTLEHNFGSSFEFSQKFSRKIKDDNF